MNILIGLFVFLSYYLGAKSIWDNRYKPSIYSRIIWLLLVLNNFASVSFLDVDQSVLVLSGLQLLGNIMILLLSLKKSTKVFGQTEKISTVLLITSLAVWIFTDLPLLNLSIGLIAHLLAGIPTIRKGTLDPHDEDILFWVFFFMASVLTIMNVQDGAFADYLYPVYFATFDGIMVTLYPRRYFRKKLSFLGCYFICTFQA